MYAISAVSCSIAIRYVPLLRVEPSVSRGEGPLGSTADGVSCVTATRDNVGPQKLTAAQWVRVEHCRGGHSASSGTPQPSSRASCVWVVWTGPRRTTCTDEEAESLREDGSGRKS